MTLAWLAAGIVLGAIAGSFLATLAVRWGRGESVMRGRSHCDACGVTVPAWRLIPILSFVAVRGRCGACGVAIDPRHPIMEMLCALIGAVALAIRPDMAGMAGALFGWLLATLALLDFDHFWLPDALVYPLGLIGIACGAAGLDPPLTDRLIGAVGGFLLLALIAWTYLKLRGRVGLGQGDVKFVAAVGAWLGWQALPAVIFAAAMIGLGWCLVAALRGRRFMSSDRLPFGTLLAMAAWACWLFASLSGPGHG